MFRGFFGPFGRPYVEGRIAIPRLNIRGTVNFLVDTGSDSSLLAALDAIRLRIDYRTLLDEQVSIGTAGLAYTFAEPVSLVFFGDDDVAYSYDIDLAISEIDADLAHMPSILGRDILDRWRMIYDPAIDELSFAVRSSDRALPVA